MAPKKKIIDKPPKVIIKREQKPMKPPPKIVEVKIGSSVALALLQADSTRTSPQQAKRLAKQTTSLDTVKNLVIKCTRITNKCVNKSTEKHSVDDSVATQKQLHSPRMITRKYVNNTIEVHGVDDSETVQEQKKKIPQPKSSKTTKKHSADKSVTPQKQLHIPLVRTRKYVIKTKGVHDEDDSGTVQEQKKKICVPKSSKTIDKHSVGDSVIKQEQLNTPATNKYVNNRIEEHILNDSETVQKQKKKIPQRKSSKTIKKHSADKSVTPQKQLHIPLVRTRKYANNTIEVHGVDDSETVQEQKKKIPQPKSSKTTKKRSVDKSATPQEQLHSPLTKNYVNKTNGIHNEDDSDTAQEHKKKICVPKSSKTIDKHSVGDSVIKQEQLNTPATNKYVNNRIDEHILNDSQTVQKQKKKRPEPKSRTMLEVMKKTGTPGIKAKSKPSREKQQTIVKSANISNEIDPENSSDILSKGLAASEGYENDSATPTKTPKGRPKGTTLTTTQIPKAKERKNEAPVFEKVIENPSPAQPYSRPNSVTISNTSNLTWTKDISTKSSISSDTANSATVTSNDCVRFDKKLKQLENSDQLKVKNDNLKQIYSSEISRSESSSSESESSSSSSSDSELDRTNTIPELNLSTSSLTPKSPLSDANTNLSRRKIENIHKAVADFQADMKTLWSHHGDYRCTDSAVLKGIDPDIDDIINKCDNFDKDLEAMSQETNNSEKSEECHRTADFTEQNESETRSLVDCRLSGYEDNHSETSSPERYRQRQKSHNDSEATFAKPCLVRRVSAASSRDTSINLPDKTSSTDSFKTFTSDNYNYVPFDRTHDDEDALSLYAESISGMESSRLDSVASVSNVSLHDVYFPKNSPTSCLQEKYVPRPTNMHGNSSNLKEESIKESGIISNNENQDLEPGKKPEDISRACVSSSNFRAMDETDLGLLAVSNRTSSIAEESVKRPEAQILSLPWRPFTTYERMNPMKSSLYRGFCFYFIAFQCNRTKCYFKHVEIDNNTFKSRLASLSEDNMIPEYLLMCSYGSLLQKFYMLFFEVSIEKEATRILLMMAIDVGFRLVKIAEHLRVQVLETTLLHLNTITLEECVEQLKFERENTMMCDVLLSCMANSQNFAQFKQTFVKLANLICELKRPVDIQVATSILERVCILPGKDFARGMLILMENTDVSIFENSWATLFENQLWKTDPKLRYVYLSAKKTAIETRLAQPDGMCPATALLIPRVAQNLPQQTSPDSTNMDNWPEALLVNSAPRRFVEPTLPLWRRGGYNMRRTQRHTRNSNRTPPGVYPIQCGAMQPASWGRFRLVSIWIS